MTDVGGSEMSVSAATRRAKSTVTGDGRAVPPGARAREGHPGGVHDPDDLLGDDPVADGRRVHAVEGEEAAIGPALRSGVEEPRGRDGVQREQLGREHVGLPPGRPGVGVGDVAPGGEAVEQATEVEQAPVEAVGASGPDRVDDRGVVGVDGRVDGPRLVLGQVRIASRVEVLVGDPGPRVVREVPRPGPDLGPDTAGHRRDGHRRHRGDDHVAGSDGADRLDQLRPLGREVRGPEHRERGRRREPFVDGEVQVVGGAPADVQVDHRAEHVVGAEHDDEGLDPGLTASSLLAEWRRRPRGPCGPSRRPPGSLRDHEPGPVVVVLDDLVDDVVARWMGGDAGLEAIGVQDERVEQGPAVDGQVVEDRAGGRHLAARPPLPVVLDLVHVAAEPPGGPEHLVPAEGRARRAVDEAGQPLQVEREAARTVGWLVGRGSGTA